jgi:excisionase family DNA binding protein
MVNKENTKEKDWLRLSEAAEYLGVHFTTLRRWSDAGQIPCMNTPGGRRRFLRTDLDGWLQRSREGEPEKQLLLTKENAQPEIIRDIRQLGLRDEPWYAQISPEHQKLMAQSGRRLIGSLMQYASRDVNRELYLQQGKKLAKNYGTLCKKSGLSEIQTMKAFVNIRHSIVDSLCEAGMIVQDSGEDTWRIYRRVNYFLDAVMLTILESFQVSSLDLTPNPD